MAGLINRTERDVVNFVRSQFATSLQGSIPALERNNVNITAVALGGGFWELAQNCKNAIDQSVMPDTAVGIHLDRLGALAGVFRFGETLAAGVVCVTGDNGTEVTGEIDRCDGVVYKIIGPAVPPTDECTTVRVCDFDACPSEGLDTCAPSPAIVTNGKAWVWVEACEPGGEGCYPAGVELEDLSSGLSAEVGPGGLTGGTDIESDDDFRLRVIAAWPGPQRAGSFCDIEEEANTAPGVTRAWVKDCCGVPKIYFVMDGCYDDSQPQADDVIRLIEYFDEPCRRPLTGSPVVCAACAQEIAITLTCVKGPSCSIPELEAALRSWLIANAQLGEVVLRDDLVAAIRAFCPGSKFSVPAGDFNPKAGGIFTTVSITVN